MDSPPSTSSGSRRAGITIPLFSLRSRRSWGIGEIADLPGFAAWMRTAGISLLQVLPLGEISGTDTSPYAALTAFGLDPMYIALDDVPDASREELRAALGEEAEARLAAARVSPRVDYATVRPLKQQALRVAFDRFCARHLGRGTARSEEFLRFQTRHAHWLGDFALYRAIKDARAGVSWTEWPAVLAERRPDALAAAQALLQAEVRYHAYCQWIAHEQWEQARAAVQRSGVELMGDLPFVVGRDSADVWAHQDQFYVDGSVGTPPDTFEPHGQDWDLPPYAWTAMSEDGFSWLHRRARHAGDLYHRFRIDHVVGLYRTYQRERGAWDAGKPARGRFDPPTEEAQLAHGESVLGAMIAGARERGAILVAEDLGTVPDFVRASLRRLGVPGYRVIIWEKDGPVFRPPAGYPAASVACFATHDTPSLRDWWESRDDAERAELARVVPGDHGPLSAQLDARTHQALLDLLCQAGSDLVLLMIQDALGAPGRINTPGTVAPDNWSYRLPADAETLAHDPSVSEALARVRRAVEGSGRAGDAARSGGSTFRG